MLRIDVQALTAAVYNRPKSDVEGATVRALLGATSGSIIHARQLTKDALPTRPFLALRARPIPTIRDVIHAPAYTWWIYDDPDQGYYRINGLLLPLARAYDAKRLAAVGCPISRVEVGEVGDETNDPALGGLLLRTINVIIYT